MRGPVVFYSQEIPDWLNAHLKKAQFEVEIGAGGAQDLIERARMHSVSWVLLDGYQFDGGYQRAVKEAGLRLAVVDDFGHAGSYPADLVVNPNLYLDPELFSDRRPATQLLLGPDFALLDSTRFEAYRTSPRETAQGGRKVLVTMGGADPKNVTSKVLQALSGPESNDLEIQIVLGGSNPHRADLERQAQERGGTVEIVQAAQDMPARIHWADVAITAGGTTCWELCHLGTPSVVLIMADNQLNIAKTLEGAGAGIDLGWFDQLPPARLSYELATLLAEPKRRRAMSQAGWALVDGQGVRRLLEHMEA
jgi:UDP-2,4-diacetamido-2,4,6-trideoxy-beta-L-altropyranose hydrolase